MSTCLLSLNAFTDHVNGTKGGLQVGCGDLIWLPLSMHVCLGLVVEYWPFGGACTRHSYSELYYLCLISSLFKLLPPPIPPCTLPTHLPNIYWPDINKFHEKIVNTGENKPLSTCQVSCTIANR